MDDSLLVELQRPDGTWVDVGVMRRRDNTNWFESFDTYWALPSRPVLGQIFENQSTDWMPSTHVALPHWFSHLLPEGMLRQAVADVARVNPATEFDLLARLGGDDLPGALRVVAWDAEDGAVTPEPVDESEGTGTADPLLKFSLAGAQMKFSVQRVDRGLTVPVRGTAGNMILKLPDSRPGFEGVPEAEHAAMTLARAIGVDTPDVQLVDAREVDGLGDWAEAQGGLSFAIDRYDRKNHNQRVHAEEFAQIINIPAAREQAKYRMANFEGVANIAAQLTGIESVGEVIDRIVVNVLVGNGDAHLKNWSVTYTDGLNPVLSPVYDVVPTVLYIQDDDLGLKLNGSRRFDDVTPGSFVRMGERTEYGGERARTRASDAAMRVLDSWSLLRETMLARHYERLTERLKILPLSEVAQ